MLGGLTRWDKCVYNKTNMSEIGQFRPNLGLLGGAVAPLCDAVVHRQHEGRV